MAVTKYYKHINMAGNEIQNAVIQPLAAAPSSPKEGQIYFNTTSDTPFVYANGAWLDLGVQGGAGATDLDISRTSSSVTVTSNTGADAIIPAADGTSAGVMTSTQFTKLSGIEAGADVTDAANVDAAGAVMNSDASTAAMSFVIDEDNMASNSASKVPTQQSTKAYVDTSVSALVAAAPGTLDTLNELAAALGDDPSFATTVATSIGTKLAKSSNLSDVDSPSTAFTNIKQAASATATGVVELATDAEAIAKTDTARAVTPANLSSFARKYVGTIGNGSLTSIAVTHGLGNQYVTAQVFDATSNEQIDCQVVLTNATTVTFDFNVAPSTNQFRVVIVG